MSSRSFREYLRKKGHEVLYMADPVDEYAVHQLEEFDGTRLKPTMEEGFDLGDQDEKKTLEELKIESEPLRKLMQEALGDKVEEAIVNDRIVNSLRVLTMSEHDLSANMERIAQQPSGSQRCRSTQQRKQWQQPRKEEEERRRRERQRRKREGKKGPKRKWTGREKEGGRN